MPDSITLHEMRVMDSSGDRTALRWNPSNRTEVDAARHMFDHYRQQGFSIFVLDNDDQRGRRLDTFDPNVRGLIAVPAMQGG